MTIQDGLPELPCGDAGTPQPRAASTLPFPAEWRMRETTHYNGGKEWFGYGKQCIEQPRLSCIDRYYRKDRSVVRTWKVDGLDCADAQAAWEALQSPATFTEEELAALAQIGDDPADHRGTLDHTIAHWLKHKGAIEYGPPGMCKRTEAGRLALAQGERGQGPASAHGNSGRNP